MIHCVHDLVYYIFGKIFEYFLSHLLRETRKAFTSPADTAAAAVCCLYILSFALISRS
jgi:hypothetical protein